jgi:hypothetical protein
VAMERTGSQEGYIDLVVLHGPLSTCQGITHGEIAQEH